MKKEKKKTRKKKGLQLFLEHKQSIIMLSCPLSADPWACLYNESEVQENAGRLQLVLSPAPHIYRKHLFAGQEVSLSNWLGVIQRKGFSQPMGGWLFWAAVYKTRRSRISHQLRGTADLCWVTPRLWVTSQALAVNTGQKNWLTKHTDVLMGWCHAPIAWPGHPLAQWKRGNAEIWAADTINRVVFF